MVNFVIEFRFKRIRILYFTETPNCKLYFTTDGTDPQPERCSRTTHIYSGAFKLKAGNRTVKAIAVERYVPQIYDIID